jgi:hypothetical protein
LPNGIRRFAGMRKPALRHEFFPSRGIRVQPNQ